MYGKKSVKDSTFQTAIKRPNKKKYSDNRNEQQKKIRSGDLDQGFNCPIIL